MTNSSTSKAGPAAEGLPSPVARRRRVWPWLLAGLLLAGGGGAYLYQRTQASSAASSAAAAVQTATVTAGTLRVSVSGPGTLGAASSSSVSASTGGTLTLVPTVGDRVTRGQLIARLRSDTAETGVQNAQLSLQKTQAQLASLRSGQISSRAADAQSVVSAAQALGTAQSSLSTAQQTLQTQTQLYAIGGVSAQDLAAARTAAQSAQSSLGAAQQSLASARTQQTARLGAAAQDLSSSQLAVQQAQVALTDALSTRSGIKLYAPIQGTVATVPVSAGQSVTGSGVGGTVVATIIDDRQIDLPVQIDETEIGAIKLGQAADVTLDALGGQVFAGKVIRISPTATTESGIAYFTVTVRLLNPEGLLRPGMTAEAEIIQSQASGLIVPKKAVESVRTRSYVQLQPVQAQAGGGAAARTRVRTGASDDTSIIVTSGLKEGDVVVLPGVAASGSSATGSSAAGSSAAGSSAAGSAAGTTRTANPTRTPGSFGGTP